MKKLVATVTLMLLAASLGWAQAEDPVDAPPPPNPAVAQEMGQGPDVSIRQDDMGPNIVVRTEGPMMGMMGGPIRGKWWKNPELAQKLGLSDDQISKMEKIFQDHRLQLIDLHAALEKQEVILDPMINADHPDEQQTLGQIDKVAQARANLEKSNARMLFAIRNVLTPEQWKKLQSERERSTVHMERGFRTGGREYRMRGPRGLNRRQAPTPPPGAPAPAPAPATESPNQ